MSDELIIAANAAIFGGALVAGILGVLAAAVWRVAARVPEGFVFGVFVGLGAWSVALLAVAAAMGGWAFDIQRGVRAEGRLVEFDRTTETVRRPGQRAFAEGPRVAIVRPVVEFTTPDGQVHRIEALGGSLAGLQPGDVVPVRYDPARPEAAIVEDFQNRYGAAMLFFNLGVIGAMGSLWALFLAIGARSAHRAAAAPAPPGHGLASVAATTPSASPTAAPGTLTRWRDERGHRWTRALARLGLVQSVLGVVLPIALAMADTIDLLKAFALVLASVALAILWFALAAALEKGRTGVALLLYGRSVGVVGFALFAAWLGGLGLNR